MFALYKKLANGIDVLVLLSKDDCPLWGIANSLNKHIRHQDFTYTVSEAPIMTMTAPEPLIIKPIDLEEVEADVPPPPPPGPPVRTVHYGPEFGSWVARKMANMFAAR